MAEIEQSKPRTTQVDEETNKPNNPLISLFQNLSNFFKFPPLKKPDAAKPETAVVAEKTEGDGEDESKPDVVRFPRQSLPQLKLEAEESEQNTNPVVLWQVYAIGGFFVLRWVWARWNERQRNKKRNKKSSDEDPSAADNDDEQ